MSKRANGEGGIHRVGKRWRAQLVIGSQRGKPIRRSVSGKTRKEVQDKLAALKRDQFAGRLAASDATTMTVGDLLTKWLTDVVATTSDANTHRLYAGLVDRHIRPHLGSRSLTDVRALDVDELMAYLVRQGTGARTRQTVYMLLKQAFRQAVTWHWIGHNPADAASRPRVATREYPTLDARQVRTLLTAARSHRLFALFYLAIVTGMRRGELVGLKWSDIDFDAGHLTVRRQVAYDNHTSKPRVKEAKTARSHRKIDLPAEAIPVLKAHQAQSLREGFAALPWVFVSTAGTFIGATALKRIRQRLLAQAGLPEDLRLHDLRHSHATLLLLAGTNPKVVQERLGHSRIGTTMDIYSHVLPSMQREAADKIGQLVKAPA